MDQKAPWFLGVLAIVMAALFSRGVPLQRSASESPAAQERPGKEDKPKEDKAKQKEVWTDFCALPCLYQEFFGIPLSVQPETLPAAAQEIAQSAYGQDYALEFLVALVPDPVDSHLSSLFDEALVALQQGIAQSGYLFDRVSLPWEGEAAKAQLYRRIPGGMLFRGTNSRRLLAVFLVGETPKAGIQKHAFYTSLDLITELQKESKLCSPLRILGPSFSGSAESLRIALKAWQADRGSSAPPLDIKMVTGSATAAGLEKHFQMSDAGVEIELSRTVVQDVELEQQAFKLLEERLGWNRKEMVLLSEFDTAYGQVSEEPEKPGEPKEPEKPYRIVVPFPSNLAHIRTAREKLGLDRDQKSSGAQIATTRKALGLSLADQNNPVDVVPQFNDLSTQANDLALANLLRTLARKQVRYIGIRATDIQDRLFLAEQIRSFCPDAVVFTFDNHLLNAHPDVAKSMDGTLVLSSFSLFPSYKKLLRQFTSEFQQGIYLAARHLVGGLPLPHRDTWVAAVGNGELWPIAWSTKSDRSPEVPPGFDKVELKWLVSALAIGLLGVWIWRFTRCLQEALASSWGKKWARGAALLSALGTSVLWLASGVLLVFYSLPLWNSNPLPKQDGLEFLLVVLTLIYLGMTFLLARLVWPPRRWIGVLLWVAAGALGLVFIQWALLKLWIFQAGVDFFYTRARDLSSGLSPLVSLTLLGTAIFAWTVFELKRCQLSVAQDLLWPLQGSPEPALAVCKKVAERLRKILQGLPGPTFWGALGFALLLCLPRLLRGIQPIAETRSYGVLFVFIVIFVFLLSALSFYRFFMTWRQLEKILERLCNTWLLPVFSRTASLLDWRPMRSFGLRMPALKMTLLSAQQLAVVSRLGSLGPDGVALTHGTGGSRGALDFHQDRLLEAETQGCLVAEGEARRDLQAWFDKSTAQLERLRASGDGDPVPLDAQGKPVPRPREVEMREIETYLAIRVTAYLRYVFAHLRYTLFSATLCGLTLLVAVSTYAFQPKRFLSFGIWVALLAGSLMTLRSFMQMDRNGALSAISGTDAGKVTLDRTFFSNLLTYGGIPVLGVVLTQFPAVGHLFGEWLDPLLRLVGKV